MSSKKFIDAMFKHIVPERWRLLTIVKEIPSCSLSVSFEIFVSFRRGYE